MKLSILTLGSRGDVQPYVALGRGLQAAGHKVVLVTAEQYGDFVTGHGLDFAPVDRRFLELTDTTAGQAAFEGRNKMGLFKMVLPAMRQIIDDCWAAAQGSDAIIYHLKMLGGYHIAEKLGIPAIKAMPIPVYPTASFTNPVAGRELPKVLNKLSYAVNDLGKAPFMGIVNDWRQSVGLRPRGRLAAEKRLPDGEVIPVLQAYSPLVVANPPDWPVHVTAAGYWFLEGDPTWQPPAELVDFLDAGPPPVYIGFGSMLFSDPERKFQILIDALQRAGQRGIIASGWGLRSAPKFESFYMLDQAPHDWLFPRMAAVVHHGGAGTTAAGLRAGKPSVIVPFFGDQSFWGRRVHSLGAGPAPVLQKKLTVEALAAAIEEAVTGTHMRARAAEIGAAIEAEDGVGEAVRFIESRLAPGSIRVSPAIGGDRNPISSGQLPGGQQAGNAG
jgi:sterol 3beta-glucosyltransferase